MPFAQIVGHEPQITVLRRALAGGRIPPAYLFVGPANVGKTAVALELASALNCEDDPLRQADDGCGACGPCRRIRTGTFPDVRLLRPMVTVEVEAEQAQARPIKPKRSRGKVGPAPETPPDTGTEEGAATGARTIEVLREMEGAMHRIDQVREIISQASLQPVAGRRKVFIITSADAMNAEAANALLKTLEEPPGDTTIILTSAQPSRLLPTIISRCQTLRFGPVSTAEALAALRARCPEVAEQALHAAIALSGGRFGWAVALLSRPEILTQRERVLELAATLPQMRLFQAMRATETLVELARQWWLATEQGDLAKEMLKRNQDRVLRTTMGELLDLLATWFRDLAALRADPETRNLVNLDRAELLRGVLGFYTAQACVAAGRSIEQARGALRGNANLRLALEALMLRLIGLTAQEK